MKVVGDAARTARASSHKQLQHRQVLPDDELLDELLEELLDDELLEELLDDELLDDEELLDELSQQQSVLFASPPSGVRSSCP